MKRYCFIIILFATLTSCHTALQISQVDIKRPQMTKSNMEFIGFNNMNRNNFLFRDFGAELERCNIADNKQDFYFGTFNLQDLAKYTTDYRYVTFIDVVRHVYSHSDAVHDNNGLEIGGWVVAAITAFTLVPVYVPMLCAADANDCQINLNGEYKIVVYDTETKKVVMNTPVQVREQDIYSGQYSHKETDRIAVEQHYKNILYNTLLQEYANVYNAINALSK